MVAVAWAVCRRSHHAALYCPHRCTLRTGKVKPGMKRRFAGKGVCPRAVGVRDAPRRSIQRKAILFGIPRSLHRQSRQQAECQPRQHQCHDAPPPSAYFCCLSAPFCPHTLSPYPESVCTINGRENINKKQSRRTNFCAAALALIYMILQISAEKSFLCVPAGSFSWVR